jgi:hypothetical protein
MMLNCLSENHTKIAKIAAMVTYQKREEATNEPNSFLYKKV